MLDLGGPGDSGLHQQPPSRAASLPIYTPTSRSPITGKDLLSNYQAINLTIPSGNSYSRQAIHTLSDNDMITVPTAIQLVLRCTSNALQKYEPLSSKRRPNSASSFFNNSAKNSKLKSTLVNMFAPARLLTQTSSGGALHSPISPTTRVANPQQPPSSLKHSVVCQMPIRLVTRPPTPSGTQSKSPLYLQPPLCPVLDAIRSLGLTYRTASSQASKALQLICDLNTTDFNPSECQTHRALGRC